MPPAETPTPQADPPGNYEPFTPEVGVKYEGIFVIRSDTSTKEVNGLHVLSELDFYRKEYFRKVTRQLAPSLDPKGAVGATKAPLWLLPPVAMETASWAHKQGADKYKPYNWRETKVCASTYISAMLRHLNAWRDGEDVDRESQISHLGHIIANANILLDAQHCRNLTDDRAKLPSLSPQCPD